MPSSYLIPMIATKEQVGLGNVTNDAQLKASQLISTIIEDNEKVPSSKAVLDYSAEKSHNHNGIYEPADSDIQTHISASSGNPHNVTKTDVGLSNLTNDLQLKASQLETVLTDSENKVPASSLIVDELTRSKYLQLHLYDYYYRNTKQIANCDYLEGWANNHWNNSTGSYSYDSTNFLIGLSATKLTTSGDLRSGIHLLKNLDLSTFNDGSASSTSDYISFDLYISQADINKLESSNWIGLFFGCDAIPTVTNNFTYIIYKSNLNEGWNHFAVTKDSFVTTGSPNWNNILGVALYLRYTDDSGIQITIDNIQLVRKDPLTTTPNPFQRYINSNWERDFYDADNKYFLGMEFGNIVARNIDGYQRQCISIINNDGTLKAIVNVSGTLYEVDLSAV